MSVRVKFKAEGMRKESGEAGRKESNSAGQTCCIKTTGHCPVGMVEDQRS